MATTAHRRDLNTPQNSTGRGGRVGRALTASAALVALALFGASCTDDSGWSQAPVERPLRAAGAVSELRSVSSCDELVEVAMPLLQQSVDSMWSDVAADYLSDTAAPEEGLTAEGSAGESPPATTTAPLALTGEDGFAVGAPRDATSADSATRADGAGADDSGADEPGADGQSTGTNNQERGVDESDLVKTDGDRIVSIVDGVLRVTELDGSPAIDGTLDLTARNATELFLRGDTALVIGTTYGGYPLRGVASDGFVTVDEGMASDVIGEVGPVDTPPPMPEPTVTIAPTTTRPDVPDTTVPETTAPDTTAPDTTAPDTTAPDTTAPDTTVPDTTVPETTAPDTTVPETSVPETTVVPEPDPLPFTSGTTLTLVSLEDPSAPRVIDAVEVEGTVVSAREVDGRAHIVLRSDPGIVAEINQAWDLDSAQAALTGVDSDQLLPRIAVDGEIRPLGECEDVMFTEAVTTGPDTGTGDDSVASIGPAADYSYVAPPSTVTVISVGDSLDALQPKSIQGSADTIYASTEALYVASGSWDESGSRTDVHRFDIASDGPATYTGSGTVPGRLLNQFSLSESGDTVRVVTTVDNPSNSPAATTMPDGSGRDVMIMPTPQTEGRLAVLDTTGDTLAEIGHLDGMGVGEEVQSVRFIGDMGYVVTFRQTDPFYAIDLSDPRNPRALGELKIPGFSEYLHPIGDGLLLGVGRDADPATGMDRGFKMSVFDISNPADMTETDQIVIPEAWSDVSSDHKAFTWDAERNQAIVPVTRSCDFDEVGVCAQGQIGSAIVVRVADGQLETVGEISHTSPFGQVAPMRSIVLGDDLWTLSMTALGRSSAVTPAGVDQVDF